MGNKIKIKFESNQEHQLRAVDAVVNLFTGLPKIDAGFQMGDDIVGNLPPYHVMEEHWLYENLLAVQEQYNQYAESIGSSTRIQQPTLHLQTDQGLLLEGIGKEFDNHRYPAFTVDMETGTGKTYAYLRTIHELRKNYGFRKFIIVVPSVAIYEGVVKTFEITKEHFKTLYGNETVGFTQYDGQQISKVRSFATSNFTEVMVITLDSFNKTSNLFYKATEKLPGEKKPFEYIQETRPILILDESQNYRSTISRTALRTLKPLFAINYSATPGIKPEDSPNVIFKLSPVDAFKLNLVKKIQVWGITQDYNVNDPQLSLALTAISQSAYGLAARFRTLVNEKGKMVEKVVELRKNEELYNKTKNDLHKGIRIASINKKDGVVVFENDAEMVLKEDADDPSTSKIEIFRYQIEKTILEHFARQKALKKMGIKVLSLFFIDRVANYVNDDGLIRTLFDQTFDRLKTKDDHFRKMKAAEVREGYFARKKTKNAEVYVDTAIEDEKKTKEQRELEKAAYELIMKDKEKLLNFDEKVSFIFAHSALREGWDNPNVFQICTLNTSTSENKKRQEIGRGLRLCVNQQGVRVMDEGVNILTVVANESYRSYVESLQKEYKESGDLDYPTPSDATKTDARRNDKVFNNKEFRAFWKKLCQRTTYKININTEELVRNCLSSFNNHQFHFPEPRIVMTKGEFIITTYDIELEKVSVGYAWIKLKITDTHGEHIQTTQRMKKGADLSLLANRDANLKGYKIVHISGVNDVPEVKFGNGKVLNEYTTIHFQMEKSVETDPRTVQQQQTTYPVFNLIDRTSKELGLTRPTILRIFKGIETKKKEAIFKNPEGFAAVFIGKIRELLADHIAEKIEYSLNEEFEDFDLDEAFPDHRKYPQKELIDGSRSSLYDQIQIDSDVEMRFVQNLVQAEDEKGNLVCYFKFPNTFKVNIPKIIGNYNPDWGIIRLDEKGKPTLRLVRETKGNTDRTKLRFSNEVRKIECAEKHFEKIGIDYRTVDDKIEKWWLPNP
jgi:type III restriction enzyme